MTDLLPIALELHTAGISVVPVRSDGTKSPAIAWKPYTQTLPTPDQLTDWFPATATGIGMITGHISGNIEMLEVEGKGMPDMPNVLELLDGAGLRPLYDRVLSGWSEMSPSGGLHLFYTVDQPINGNTKIAQRPADGPTGRDTIAETRGEGGFVVLAPSHGAVHPTGAPWMRLTGGPTTIAHLTGDERDDLHLIFHAALDTMPDAAAPNGQIAAIWDTSTPRSDGDITPGDDYETRTDWSDILTGWTLVFTRGTTRYWRRPGKKDGISATTGHADDRDRLYVFTSSTSFDPETPYTKFGAYTHLHHGGDHTAAARTLAGTGYGHRAERTLTPTPTTSSSGERYTSNGSPLAALNPVTIGSTDADLTDDGNAKLLTAAHARTLKYVPDMGRWATWDDTRWKFHPDDAPAIEAGRDVIRSIPEDHKALREWKKKSLSTRSITGLVRLARADPHMRVAADQFDRHAWQLNTPDGIVNLRTGDTATPLSTLWHSKQTKVRADPDRPTPLWNQFLATTFQHDLAMEQYLQRLVGLSTIGEVIEHVLPFFHGGGGNGKTVFLETITTLLGDYATEAPSGFLLAGRDRHETEIANLQGRRLVVASEVNENTRFDEAKMKSLTGGDKITARFMRQDFFTFTPSHTLWLMGNNQPKVETGGFSFWRRLRLIPFTHTVPEKDRIDNLQERLVAEEGPGILHWIIRGAVDYARDGLNTPPQVLAATNAYKEEEDHLGRFVEERCTIGGGENARVDTTQLRHLYDDWCRDENETELNGTAFGRQLKQKFDVGSIRSNGRRYYTNIAIVEPEPEVTEDGIDAPWWQK